MIDNTHRKVKVIGYQEGATQKTVDFITFYHCDKCNDFVSCVNPSACKFVGYICERMPKGSTDYNCMQKMPVLKLQMTSPDETLRAQQVIARAQKLRTNRALTRVKVK